MRPHDRRALSVSVYENHRGQRKYSILVDTDVAGRLAVGNPETLQALASALEDAMNTSAVAP